MQLAKSSAIYAAPIPLRILLAVTFIWAGLGKIIHEVPVQGEQAALLANMGYKFDTQPTTQPDAADASEPNTQADTQPNTQPDAQPDAPSEPDTDQDDEGAAGFPAPPPSLIALAQTEADEQNAEAAPAAPLYTAADFPEPAQVKSLYMVAVLTYTAAHPAATDDGSTPSPIWPEWAARDHWPITMAWVASITELAAGILIAIALLTRFDAVALASTMLTAAWLTELGPAIQAGDTLLWFLPNYDIWDIYAWRPLLWQFALTAAAVSLALAGPGALGLDRAPGDAPTTDELEED